MAQAPAESTFPHEFLVGHCTSCERLHFPPQATCPFCWRAADVVPSAGTASILTFSVVHRSRRASIVGKAPFVVAVVRLDEGLNVVSNVTGCDVDDVHVGMDVEVAFRTWDHRPVPVFVPRTPTPS